MRQLFKICTAILLSVTMFSCSEDDSSSSSTANTSGELIDNWQLAEFTYTGSSTTEVQGNIVTSNFNGEAFDINSQMNFTENPNEVTASGSYTIALTYTVQGNTQTQNVPINDFSSVGTWSRNENTLTIAGELISISLPGNSSGGNGISEMDYTIQELSDTVLKLVGISHEVTSDQGITVATDVSSTVMLTRNSN